MPNPPPAPEKTVPVVDQLGNVGTVPAAQAEKAYAEGMRPATAQELAAAHAHAEVKAAQEKYGGLKGGLLATAAGAARGATVGMSDPLALGVAEALGGKESRDSVRETLEGLKKANPKLSVAGELAGAVAPLALSGGGAGVAEGGAAVARAGEGASAIARAAEAGGAAVRGAGTLTRGVALAGDLAEHGAARLVGTAAGSVAGRAGQAAVRAGARGAVEGGLFGAGQQVSEDALGDHQTTGEKVAAAFMRGALLGGGTGGALGAAGSVAGDGMGALLRRYGPGLEDAAGEQAWRALDPLKKFSRQAEARAGGTREVGKTLLREGVIPSEGGLAQSAIAAEEMLPRIESAKESVGAQIGELLGQSKGTVAPEALLKPIDDIIAREGAKAGHEHIVSSLQKYRASLAEKLGIGVESEGARAMGIDTELEHRVPGGAPANDMLADRMGESLESPGVTGHMPGGSLANDNAALPWRSVTVPGGKAANANAGRLPKTPVERVNHIGVDNTEYMRDGMRDLGAIRRAYEGATPEEAQLIATGRAPSRSTGRPLEPVKVIVEDGQVVLRDGRHRLMAAKEAGAKDILAEVTSYTSNGRKVTREVPVSIHGTEPAVSTSRGVTAHIPGGSAANDVSASAWRSIEVPGGASANDTAAVVRGGAAANDAVGDVLGHRHVRIPGGAVSNDTARAIPVQELVAQRRALDDLVYRESKSLDPNQRVALLREVRAAMHSREVEAIDDAARTLGGPGGKELQALNRRYQHLSLAEDAAKETNARAATNRQLSLSDNMAMMGEASSAVASGHPLAALGAPLVGAAHKWAREHGNAIAASALAKMSRLEAVQRVVAETDARLSAGVRGLLEAPPATKAVRAGARVVRAERGETRSEAYAKQATRIRELAGDPEALTARLHTELGDLDTHAPQVTAAAGEATGRVASYLKGIMPVALNANDPWAHLGKPRVSHAEIDAYEKSARGALDPLGVLDDMRKGSVAREEIQAVKACYPQLYQQMQGEVLGHLMRATEPPAYLTRVRLGTLFDVPADVALSQHFLASVAAAQAPKAPAKRASPSGGISSAQVRLATQIGTESDRLEAGTEARP